VKVKNSISRLLGVVTLLVSMQASVGYADTQYYVELGKDSTKDEAVTEWKSLVSKHKSMLNKLQYYPKAVMQGGVAVSTRIQAGPITNKAKAQKICTKLFVDNIPCFVIEGTDGAPPTQIMNLSETAEAKPSKGWLPWLTSSSSDEVQAPAPVKETSALPWLNAPAENPNRKGQVEVAEAIRVPLTDSFNPEGNGKVTVKALPDIKPTFRKQFAENNIASTAASEPTGSGWLTVDTFPNDDVALSYWQEVRGTLPKKDSNLRVRVLKPLMSQQTNKASLSIGPFASNAEALAFCGTIQARERGLNCGFDGANASGGNIQVARADAYNNRRSAQARRRPVENGFGDIAPAAGPSKQYWVQVLSASNQLDALHQWESMKASNSDLLNGMRSSVSPSAVNKDEFVVRVGPIVNNEDAIKFCTKLQGRGISCRVLLYSLGAKV